MRSSVVPVNSAAWTGGRLALEMLRCTKTPNRAQKMIAESYRFPPIRRKKKLDRVELLDGVSSEIHHKADDARLHT